MPPNWQRSSVHFYSSQPCYGVWRHPSLIMSENLVFKHCGSPEIQLNYTLNSLCWSGCHECKTSTARTFWKSSIWRLRRYKFVRNKGPFAPSHIGECLLFSLLWRLGMRIYMNIPGASWKHARGWRLFDSAVYLDRLYGWILCWL